jgi:hypothetical protein
MAQERDDTLRLEQDYLRHMATGRRQENTKIHCWYSDENFAAVEKLETD